MLGMLAMDEWPRNSDNDFGRKDYFAALLSSEHPPEYFVVVKRFGNRKVVNWKDDKVLLEITRDFPIVAQDDDYVVFDLTKRVPEKLSFDSFRHPFEHQPDNRHIEILASPVSGRNS
jgi:hypothetical protein